MYYSNSVKLLRATVLVWVLVLQQVNSCKEKERGALLELKKGLVDDFGILSSWDDSPDCCSWWGISCSNQTGQVVELDLHAREYDKPLRGPIPSFKNCSQLVMLDVAHNKLVGPIPQWLGYNLHKLQVLSMRNNHLNGSLPLDLCHLTAIQVLDLSLNNLSGQIPNCLQNLSAMSRKPTPLDAIDVFYVFMNHSPLYFFRYDFYPTVKWKGKELSFKDNQRLLKLIDMSDNELSGKIPREIGNLSELVSFDLSGNHLSGEIPWEFGNLHALEFFDLSANHMSGTIPSSLSQLNWLTVLNLSHNNLSGKIPSGTQLQSFDASAYDGNPYLCGSPLKRLCADEKGSKAPWIEEEEDDSFISQGFYISMGLGFVTGFWVIFGSLLIFPSWRHAYFTFLSNLYQRIVVVTLINLARCHRLLRR